VKLLPLGARPLPPVRVAPLTGRPSWDLGGVGLAGSPFFRIREVQNLRLYGQLREAVPLINGAIRKLKQFVGCPFVEAEDPVKADIELWLETVISGRLQSGFANWFPTYLDDMLTYGRSHTEMVLNSARNDVFSLVPLEPKTIHIRPNADGFSLDLVQDALGGASIVTLPPALMLNAFHEVCGDDPYGRSVLYSLPFITEIWTGMVKALGDTWARMGSPSYQVHVQFPDEFNDPEGDKAGTVVSQIQSRWEDAMKSRKNADIRDFFSWSSADGDVRVTILGAEGEVLEFETPARALMEQITANLGLPPFLFGLHWSTTERMSAVMASLLTEMIDSVRNEVRSQLTYMIDFRQRLVGRPGKFKLCWPDVSVMDAFETARAELVEAQAEELEIENGKERWRMGLWSRYDFARAFVESLEGKTEPEIDAALPDLPLLPPERDVKPPGALGMTGDPNAPPVTGAQMLALNGNGR
jgi:hypothetical protein